MQRSADTSVLAISTQSIKWTLTYFCYGIIMKAILDSIYKRLSWFKHVQIVSL